VLVVDSKGLVVKGRKDLVEHKLRFAHDHPPAATLLEAVESAKPTALIGVSGMPQTFDEPVLRAMAPAQRAPRGLRALEPDLAGGVHRRAGLRMDGRRRSSPAAARSRPSRSTGRRTCPGRATTATSSRASASA